MGKKCFVLFFFFRENPIESLSNEIIFVEFALTFLYTTTKWHRQHSRSCQCHQNREVLLCCGNKYK